MKYRLIGIDLDGTLLNEHGTISEANRAALKAAQQAGAMVVPCTGRGWREAHMVLRDLPGVELGVFVTGAMVSEIATGRSVDFSVIEPHLALALVDHLRREPEAVLVYREPALAGHDYLVTGEGELTANTEWWFQATGANVHFQRHVTAEDLHHSLRVGMVAGERRLPMLSQRIVETFGERVQLHHFAALQQEDAEAVHVLEIFASGVDKWRGLRWIAEKHGIGVNEIAAIGDEVNDLSMIRGAACGVAMGNAINAVRDVADRMTVSNCEDGVAGAIERMIAGEW